MKPAARCGVLANKLIKPIKKQPGLIVRDAPELIVIQMRGVDTSAAAHYKLNVVFISFFLPL